MILPYITLSDNIWLLHSCFYLVFFSPVSWSSMTLFVPQVGRRSFVFFFSLFYLVNYICFVHMNKPTFGNLNAVLYSFIFAQYLYKKTYKILI